jgi:hypothetical protein
VPQTDLWKAESHLSRHSALTDVGGQERPRIAHRNQSSCSIGTLPASNLTGGTVDSRVNNDLVDRCRNRAKNVDTDEHFPVSDYSAPADD